jgi:FXSXX-COOH protein
MRRERFSVGAGQGIDPVRERAVIEECSVLNSVTGEPLPDYTGTDLEEIREYVDHPVLSAVLAGLAVRARSPEDAVAYYNDSPGPMDES